jgi:hypothetical protein
LTLLPSEILIKKLALITTDTRLPRSASHRARARARAVSVGMRQEEASSRETRQMHFNQRFAGSVSLSVARAREPRTAGG